MQIKRSFILSIVVFCFANPSLACKLTPDSTWNLDKKDLVKKTDFIVLAKLKSIKRHSGEQERIEYVLEVIRVLKGKQKKRALSIFVNAQKFPQPDSTERASYDKDCSLQVHFEDSKQYLIFDGSFNPNGYREIHGKDDEWLRTVVEMVKKP